MNATQVKPAAKSAKKAATPAPKTAGETLVKSAKKTEVESVSNDKIVQAEENSFSTEQLAPEADNESSQTSFYDGDERVTLHLRIEKIDARNPATQTRIKTLKNGEFKVGSAAFEDTVLSPEAFTQWFAEELASGRFGDLSVEEAIVSLNDEDGESVFRARTESLVGLKAIIGYHFDLGSYEVSIASDMNDSLAALRLGLTSVVNNAGGVKLISGGVEVSYPETESTEALLVQYVIRNGVTREVTVNGKKKPVMKEITLFDLAERLLAHREAKANISVMPSVEGAFDYNNANVLIVEIDGERQALTNPGALVKAVKASIREGFEERMLGRVQDLVEAHAAIASLMTELRGDLGTWVKDIDDVLPDLEKTKSVNEGDKEDAPWVEGQDEVVGDTAEKPAEE